MAETIPTYAYLPLRTEGDPLNRVGYRRVKLTELTEADKVYLADIDVLRNSQMENPMRSPEIAVITLCYLDAKAQEKDTLPAT